jgi:hypothetical protein
VPTAAPTTGRCARCGHAAAADDLVCTLCGEVLRRASRGSVAVEAPRPVPDAWASPPEAEAPARDGRWIVLGVGLFLAPVLTLTPLLQYVGWFLASLVHETGHSAMAWLLGCPAFPAISLHGHAAAFHREQKVVLCALVVAGLLAFAWSSRQSPRRLGVAIALLVAYPVAAFTGVREALFLLAGHLGELAFAAYAFSRALDGGFSGTNAERFAHAGVAWYLVGRDGLLAIGLLTSDAARATYATNGSFGLENDLVRFSRECLRTSSLAPGALLLLGVTVAIVGVAVFHASRRSD